MQRFKTQDEEGIAKLVAFDPEFIDDAPNPIYPWLLWTFIKIKAPDNEGLWNPNEEETLLDLLDGLLSHLQRLDLYPVGFIVREGWMELYSYATQPKRYENAVAEVLKPSAYMYENGSRRDSKWEFYRYSLYPDALTWLYIQSDDTIEALETEGDTLEQSREAEHYIFAQTQAQRERMIGALEAEGFTCKEQVENRDEAYAFVAVMVYAHNMQSQEIYRIVEQVYAIVSKEHGHYEGWSTTLMPGEEA